MNKTSMATFENIDDIVDLRVEMQIEDWNETLGKNFSCYSDEFAQITKSHLENKLNISIFLRLYILNVSLLLWRHLKNYPNCRK